MRGHHDVHVTSVRPAIGRGWQVVQGGRVLSHHHRQTTAVKNGRRAARRDHVELVTHRRDGRIRAKDSYGRESPRRDREH